MGQQVLDAIFYDDFELEGEPSIRVMSTFSGIGAASLSWRQDLFDFAAYAEIEPFPCHVLHYRLGASRPKYMPSPYEPELSDEERKARAQKIKDVAGLPTEGKPNYGDIAQITDEDLEALGQIDVLEGGSPCQGFSVAGIREGLDDPRSNLLLAFCQLAERMRRINQLQFVVWENVHGVLSDKTGGFGALVTALSGTKGPNLQPPGRRWTNAGYVRGPEGRRVAWRTIEASHWGVPQRRKRVFVVANIGGSSASPEEVLFESESSRWHLKTGLRTRKAVVSTYRGRDGFEYRSAKRRLRDPKVIARLKAETSSSWIGLGSAFDGGPYAIDMKSQPTASERAYALTAQNAGNPPAVAYALADDYVPKASKHTAYALLAGSPSGGGRQQMVVHPERAGTLCTSGAGLDRPAGMASETDFGGMIREIDPTSRHIVISPTQSGTLYAREAAPIGVSSEKNFVVITRPEHEDDPRNWLVRKFTPLECERLQGFPDYWTDVPYKGALVADSPRYKAIGNSMACPNMAFIGHFLELAIFIDGIDFDAWEASRKRKRGRPPKNGVSAMSAAERQRQRRARLKQGIS